MIEVKGVQKWYGRFHALRDINVEFRDGVTVILGPSGSGKSTLLRCINGLEKINEGDIVVNGLSVKSRGNVRQIREWCGMVFQQFNLFPHLTALQNVSLCPIHVLKKSKKEAYAAARQLLEMVGLGDKVDSYPAQLSGGQQQRVAIARALAMQPKALLLDEVTSALDPEMTGEVLEVIERLAKEGTTMIVVTHEIAFASKVADRILFMDDGIILADQGAGEFFSDSSNERIQRFLKRLA